jgi:hypothetical protein
MAKDGKQYQARRALFIPGVGRVARGDQVTLSNEQYRANKNSLVEVKGGKAADEAIVDRMDDGDTDVVK